LFSYFFCRAQSGRGLGHVTKFRNFGTPL